MNERLNTFSEKINLILDNQAGFRKNYSPLDHIFSLYTLIETSKYMRKKLYCTFIDFEKAFDRVWRLGLYNKILFSHIDGKCFNVIVSMYNGIKSNIVLNGKCSDYFSCNIGVRQGENLSPFLFSIFLNDLETFLTSHNAQGLHTMCNKVEQDFGIYLRLFVLLYADDTILLSESPEDMQQQLNIFNDYCKLWNLKVNVNKTKIVIFGRGRQLPNTHFYFNDTHVEVVDEFKYLGVVFSKNNSFKENIKQLYDKAVRAMYGVLSKCRKHNLSIDCKLDLFDKIVKPIVLYGCEIWGFSNCYLIEKLHLKFCKHILDVKQSTPNFMVYGELGGYPISINIKVRMISFWCKLVNSYGLKMSSKLYHVLRYVNSPWIKYVHNILDECGLSYLWYYHDMMHVEWLKQTVLLTLTDQFKQKWNSDMFDSSKGINYRIFKKELTLEKYFSVLPVKYCKLFCKFRTMNHKLPIETGRWHNISGQNRICTLCNYEIGDEFHYLFNCKDTEISNCRKTLIPKYFCQNPNTVKFDALFNLKNRKLLFNICKFIEVIMERVSSPG